MAAMTASFSMRRRTARCSIAEEDEDDKLRDASDSAWAAPVQRAIAICILCRSKTACANDDDGNKIRSGCIDDELRHKGDDNDNDVLF